MGPSSKRLTAIAAAALLAAAVAPPLHPFAVAARPRKRASRKTQKRATIKAARRDNVRRMQRARS